MDCRICGTSIPENQEITVREMMFGYRDEFKYYQCPNCKCLQIKECPNSMEKYYPSGEYYSFKQIEGVDSFIRNIKNRLRQRRDEWYLGKKSLLGGILVKIKPITSDKLLFLLGKITDDNSNILDVGCGSGDLIRFLYDAGLHNVEGLDAFADESEPLPNGNKIHISDILDFTPEKKYDVIIFSHSLEHIFDQEKTLKKAASILKEDGNIIIAIPIVGNAFDIYRENWVELDAPRHFFLHSKHSMEIMASRTGLCINEIINDGITFYYEMSEYYKNNIAMNEITDKDVLPNYKLKEFQRKVDVENLTGQGVSRAIFVLKKK